MVGGGNGGKGTQCMGTSPNPINAELARNAANKVLEEKLGH